MAQSDEKSDCASAQQSLCGVALICEAIISITQISEKCKLNFSGRIFVNHGKQF
jgi:hypothetical protein